MPVVEEGPIWAWATRDLIEGEHSLVVDVWAKCPIMRRVDKDTVLWIASGDEPEAQCLETLTISEAAEYDYVVPATWREIIRQPLWLEVVEEEE